MADFQKPKDPNWVCTFSVLVDSDKMNQKTGKAYRKNFTIDGTWMEASCYIQDNKDLKITIKKTGSKPASDGGFEDQF